MNTVVCRTASIALLALLGACTHVVRPPTALQGSEETAPCPAEMPDVQIVKSCARNMESRYTRAAMDLRDKQFKTDISLITLATGSAGVGLFDGSPRITQGAAIVAGLLTGIKTYVAPAQASAIYFKAARRMQCVADRGDAIARDAQDHLDAMHAMNVAYVQVEHAFENDPGNAYAEAFDEAYAACRETPAARFVGGYPDIQPLAPEQYPAAARAASPADRETAIAKAEADAAKAKADAELAVNLADKMREALRDIDRSTISAILDASGKFDDSTAKVQAIIKEARTQNDSENAMTKANEEVANADEPAAGAPAPTTEQTEVKEKADEAVAKIPETTRELHQRIFDLLECTSL